MIFIKNKIWNFLDVEGPQVLNDNAQENTVALAEKSGLGEKIGIEFYKRMSIIDDIWGDFHKVDKDPFYSSGHTLKVILPFYKAMGATLDWLCQFARESIRIVPNIAGVLKNLDSKYNVRLISTSYDFFIQSFCDLVGFDFRKVFCTRVQRFDQISISQEESEMLKLFMKQVASWPPISYDEKTGDVYPQYQRYYDLITGFVWEFVYYLPVGNFLKTVDPVGQQQKREALIRTAQKFEIPLEKIFFVGDSQTDVQCVQYLKEKGLTMVFNGKGKVCDEADLMYIGEDARAIEEVANLFAKYGRERVIKAYTPYRNIFGGIIAAVTSQNLDELKAMSERKRKEFRGVHIGELT